MPTINKELNKLRPEEIVSKCSKKRFCSMLDVNLNDSNNGHQKGLSVLQTMNIRTKQWNMPGVVYMRHSGGDMGKYGIVINFCPWCGTDLIKLFGTKEMKKTHK